MREGAEAQSCRRAKRQKYKIYVTNCHFLPRQNVEVVVECNQERKTLLQPGRCICASHILSIVVTWARGVRSVNFVDSNLECAAYSASFEKRGPGVCGTLHKRRRPDQNLFSRECCQYFRSEKSFRILGASTEILREFECIIFKIPMKMQVLIS